MMKDVDVEIEMNDEGCHVKDVDVEIELNDEGCHVDDVGSRGRNTG